MKQKSLDTRSEELRIVKPKCTKK